MRYESTFSNKLIYIFRINDSDHEGALKIGETEAPDGFFEPNSSELNKAAKIRINQYTQTAGIRYELLHTELTVYFQGGKVKSFNDKQVHELLLRSGIQRKSFQIDGKSNEWFICDLETAKKAIEAVKEGKQYLNPGQITQTKSPIKFRPEQILAIEQTKKVFFTGNKMLWNAKMRMGKTLTSLQVIKDMAFSKSIIITHRPVVDDGWFEDFGKIFYETDSQYAYGSRNRGVSDVATLERSKKKYIYFASLQDLRGSELVGGNFDKNNEIFSTEWDLVIIDEAHEGTQTALGQAVLDELIKPDTKVLNLSGTPFNLMKDFDEKTTFTWDYMMEQQAKAQWYKDHPGDPNPYEELPKLNIYTFDLAKVVGEYKDEDLAFNFREFFRTWTGDRKQDHRDMPQNANVGDFVHLDAVKRFLDIISHPDRDSAYPFATEQYREFFRHTLWMVPGVKEGKALTDLMRVHPIFASYTIVNVAGNEDEESIYNNDALQEVKTAIGVKPEDTYTITISCGKLTTGVTIKPWTAVLMLSGSKNTSPQNYMQTIFRVQSPAVIGGRQKTQCYVFDFAPDRTLKMIAESIKISCKAGGTTSSDRESLGEFLNFCPIISVTSTNMAEYNVDQMMQQLKRVYVDRVVNNGFEDQHLYNNSLLNLSQVELEKFADLQDIIGQTKAQKKTDKVEINNQGFDQEQIEKEQKKAKKEGKNITEEEARRRLELDRRKKQRSTAISILRGISIRMPMLIYGADIQNEDEPLTLDRFVELVDDQSWEEFMPKGVTKDRFAEFKQYYDEDVFAAAGKQIRELARAADSLPVLQRIQRIVNIFASFRNPDKETVLTPWRVVNMHMSDCLGGYSFYDDEFKNELPEPRLINRGLVTNRLFENSNVRILEINSKSGLYPLYVTYSVFMHRCRVARDMKSGLFKSLSQEEEYDIWFRTLSENIFVICKTEMARKITRRTLVGFTNNKINSHVYDDLINQITNKQAEFISKITTGRIFKQINNNMKFDAIVGNPPYQVVEENRSEQPPVYHHFYDISFNLSKRVSLISPARFLANAGKTPTAWNEKMLNDEHFKVVKFFANSKDVFPTVDIKGGVAITYRDTEQDFGKIGEFIFNDDLRDLLYLVKPTIALDSIMYSNTSYKYSDEFFKENPSFEDRVSGGSRRYLASPAFDVFPEVFFNDKPNNEYTYIKIFGRQNNHRASYYFNLKYLTPPDNYNKFKVFIPSANGSGALGEKLSNPFVAEPLVGATETFVSFGCFDSKFEAEALLKYVKTKFARALLSTKKITQSNKNSLVWSNIPLQDFSVNSDIDWTKDISNIDLQLYKKYNLPQRIIDFLEINILAMD